MRWLAVILLLMAAPLAARSPASPMSYARPVGDRHQFLLVYKHDPTGERKFERDALPDPHHTREFPYSGLYANDASRRLIWRDVEGWIDPYLGMVFLSRDGRKAHLVSESDQGGALTMLHDGCAVHTTYLAGPLYSPQTDRTHRGWPRLAWNFQQVGGLLYVRRTRDAEGWCFSLESGEFARIRTPKAGNTTWEGLKAFESALLGADASANIPPGATLHVSDSGAVRLLRVPKLEGQAQHTAAIDTEGNELWQVPEYLPAPWFLGPTIAEKVVSHWDSPWHQASSYASRLIVASNGSAWGLVTVTESGAVATVRLFREGKESNFEVKGTLEVLLKFSGISVLAVSDQEFAVEFSYGLDWAERYVFHIGTGEMKHQRPPDPDQPVDSAPSRATGGGWEPVIGLALFAAVGLLLAGFLIGRRFATK